MQTQAAVEELVAQLIPSRSISAETDIFESGLVNSLFALQLINRLEQVFKFEIDEDDLERSNFESIAKMTEFVLRKQSAGCMTQS